MSNRHTPRSVFSFLPIAFALAALAGRGADAQAQQSLNTTHEPATVALSIAAADLERAFWICDYAATTGSIATPDAALCHAVYDRLKAEKFGGDFERLLAWWRANKVAEHRKLDVLAIDAP